MNLWHRRTQQFLFNELNQGINKGTLHVITPEKETRTFKGEGAGVEVEWIIHDWSVINAIILRGDIGLGECYTKGAWDTNNLADLFILYLDNMNFLKNHAYGTPMSRFFFQFLNGFIRRNTISKNKKNIHFHYDIGNDFYGLWLDRTMTYSSALFSSADMPLEKAQIQKNQRILDKMTPGREKILEIGCGWGGFAEQATKVGHHVTGITISEKQFAFTEQRLKGVADIRLEDYRVTKGLFDAICSIEMVEAVGKHYWPNYFSTVKKCLAKDGVAMIQVITIADHLFDEYDKSSDYIRHHVFPGGFLPTRKIFQNSAENAGLICKDVFEFGESYVLTLQQWLQRFEYHEKAIKALGYADPFIRNWRLYLSMCIASFTCKRTNVMQVELVHG